MSNSVILTLEVKEMIVGIDITLTVHWQLIGSGVTP